MFRKLWKDDGGIVALEYLMVATIVGLGLAVGLSALSASLNAELVELGQAILGLNQTYSVTDQISGGFFGLTGSKDGNFSWDIIPGSVGYATGNAVYAGQSFNVIFASP